MENGLNIAIAIVCALAVIVPIIILKVGGII